MAGFSCVDDLYRSLIDESQKEKNLEMEESILDNLFRDQRYDLVLFALEKGFSLTPETIERIKHSGDLKLYQYLFTSGNLSLNNKLMSIAASSGNLETVKWLREKGCSFNFWATYSASKMGHLEVLKWLRKNGCSWSDFICSNAAANGDLKMLKYARKNGCPWSIMTYIKAVKYGHLKVVKWIGPIFSDSHFGYVQIFDQPLSERLWECAARYGHLKIIKWLLKNECPWYNLTYYYAAEGGHPEIIDWLRKNGKFSDERSVDYATRSGELGILEILTEKRTSF